MAGRRWILLALFFALGVGALLLFRKPAAEPEPAPEEEAFEPDLQGEEEDPPNRATSLPSRAEPRASTEPTALEAPPEPPRVADAGAPVFRASSARAYADALADAGPPDEETARATERAKVEANISRLDGMLTTGRDALRQLELYGDDAGNTQQKLNFGRRLMAEAERERERQQARLQELERAR